MCHRRWLSVVGALALAAGSATMLGVPAFAAPGNQTSRSARLPELKKSPKRSAKSASALGPDVASATVHPLEAAPAKPTGFSAAPGDGALTLTFDDPASGGSAIIGYDYSTDDGTNWRSLAGVTGTTTKQATITRESGGGASTPLGYNIPYLVRVRADNSEGP